MAFEQALRGSAVLLATAGFAGLMLARSIPAWLAAVTLAVFLYATLQLFGWPSGRRTSRPISPLIWNALLIGAFLLFLADLTIVSKELLPAGIHFLAILLNVKLMTLQDRRDYRHLYAISLMSILASAALTTELWYVTVFVVYLLAATWSLLLYHLTGRAALQTDQTPPIITPLDAVRTPAVLRAGPRISGKFFWLTNGIAVFTFGLTLVIFFLLPRISVGILQKPRGEGLRTTGFSERVDLGMIGSVKEDPQIVMRVELPDQPADGRERLYLRGMAFDHYTGRSWSSGSRQRRNLGLVDDGTFVVRSGAHRRAASLSEPLRQDILLEPLDTSVLFAAPFPESVSGDFMSVQLDGMTGLHLPYASPSRIRYSVVSREHRLLPNEQTSVLEYAAAMRERYLQLPPGSEHIAELARRVTDPVSPTYEKTTAVLTHLLSNYSYSLEADTTASNHPIEEFLFSRKTGYCEHYATAMVLMLRSIGIPSRLVTGFLATEWNDFGNYFTVRQRDAHAWVEVFYPQAGWITMDPTPSNTAAVAPSLWVAFQRASESLRLHWDRVFIRYSGRDQLAIIHSLRESSDSARDALGQLTSRLGEVTFRFARIWTDRAWTPHRGLLWTVILASGIGAAWLIFLRMDRWPYGRSAKQPAARTQQQIVQLYKKTLELARRRGLCISSSTTPTELARLVSEQWTDAAPTMHRVTALYCRGRFGVGPLSGEDLRRGVEDIAVLKRMSRQPH
jgi:transglutaminase-like putative cysteine protease